MTPARLSLPFQGDEMVDLEKFGSAWNNYLQNHARRSESLAHRISELEKLIADQKKTIHEYADRLKQQASTISTLEDRISDLSDQNAILTRTSTEVRDELEQNDARRKEMQAKVKSYRTKLNEAIVEQQELYKRCKTLCDGAVDSIRKEKEESKSKQQEALEQFETGMNKATAARDAMRSLLEEELRVSQAYCEKGK
jgi:chromosome segregation ATPase